jgi:hypothetical protein
LAAAAISASVSARQPPSAASASAASITWSGMSGFFLAMTASLEQIGVNGIADGDSINP